MLGDLRTREWLPLFVTVGLFAAVVYGAYATATREWADLLGLAYLLASPAVYAAARLLVAGTPDATHDAEVGA